MKVSAVAFDKQQQDDIYETETDIALEDPTISMKVSRTQVLQETQVDNKTVSSAMIMIGCLQLDCE